MGVAIVCVAMDIRVLLRPFLGGLVAALASACGFYKWDMENACHAVERSKVRELQLKSEEDVLTMAASWAAERARTSEGQRFWDAISNVTPTSKAEVFRSAAREAGIVDCPFAEQLHAAVLADELEREQRLQKLQQKSADAAPEPERAAEAEGP